MKPLTYILQLSWQEKCFIIDSIASGLLCSTYYYETDFRIVLRYTYYQEFLCLQSNSLKAHKKEEKKSTIKRCGGASTEAGFFGISIVLKGPLAAFDSFLLLLFQINEKV